MSTNVHFLIQILVKPKNVIHYCSAVSSLSIVLFSDSLILFSKFIKWIVKRFNRRGDKLCIIFMPEVDFPFKKEVKKNERYYTENRLTCWLVRWFIYFCWIQEVSKTMQFDASIYSVLCQHQRFNDTKSEQQTRSNPFWFWYKSNFVSWVGEVQVITSV